VHGRDLARVGPNHEKRRAKISSRPRVEAEEKRSPKKKALLQKRGGSTRRGFGPKLKRKATKSKVRRWGKREVKSGSDIKPRNFERRRSAMKRGDVEI